MGEEIDQEPQKMSPVMRWFFPSYARRLETLEDELYSKTGELKEALDGATLKLQRSRQQIRSLMRDVGQYKDRWQNLVIGDYNPDEVGLDEYKKMLDYDAQVIAGFDLIQMGVLMSKWKITHPDEEIVNTLTQALNEMQYPNIRDAMKEMLKAVAYGYSVTEVVYQDYKGKYWMPRQTNGLKTLDPESISFFSDEFGNLKKIEQWKYIATGRSRFVSFGGKIALPLDRVIVWSHEKEWGNWYGKALLRGCYKNWYIKDAMLKFANIAYERFGSPILLGIAATLKDIANISESITHLYARSQAVILKRDERDPTDIKVLESKRTEMPFDRYIRYHDEMILRRMLIGQRIFEGGGGTYGPKVPFDIILMRLEDYRGELTAAMNQLLRMITDLNWMVKVYPQFEFAPLTSMDQEAISRAIYEAIDREIVDKGESWIRAYLNMPPKPSDEGAAEKERPKEEE